MTAPMDALPDFEEEPAVDDGLLHCGLREDGRRCGRTDRHGHPVKASLEDQWIYEGVAMQYAARGAEKAAKAAAAAPRAPLVPQRLATDAELPRYAKLALREAQAAGWTAEVTYVRGWHAVGKREPAWVDMVTVRLWRAGAVLVGVWLDGSFGKGFDAGRQVYDWRGWRALIGEQP